jgi:cobalt-zinc-cadmium resistance protein CzcA
MVGQEVGLLYEGERRFPIALRLPGPYRASLENLSSLPIRLPSGQYIRLDEVAHIREDEGPSQISRHQTRRRIVVGVNVRGRDTEGLVHDLRAQLASLRLPPGYSIHYGGQFENLQSAKKRLTLVVPVAMGIILVLLFSTFGSLRQALLVFAAVPMAAVGGVGLLALRGMPFSISAGVGFIALSGIAVLNGIVLVGYFNQLKAEGYTHAHSRVLRGGVLRLRPVLTTALTAALGFIPMMMSTAPGSEVQRPLATVVVGGLVSSTLLTLLVLPALFSIRLGRRKPAPTNLPTNENPPNPTPQPTALLGVVLAIGLGAFLLGGAHRASAQPQPRHLRLDQAIELGRTQFAGLEAQRAAVRQAQALERTTRALPALQGQAQVGQINSAWVDVNANITQAVEWPGVYAARSRVQQAWTRTQQAELGAQTLDWELALRTQWARLQFAHQALALLQLQDSLLAQAARVLAVQQQAGVASGLPTSTALAERAQLQAQMLTQRQEMANAQAKLRVLLATADSIVVSDTLQLLPLRLPTTPPLPHPTLARAQARALQAQEQISLARRQRLPGFSGGYFWQSLDHRPGFQGVVAGFSVPMGLGAGRANLEAARAAAAQATFEATLAQQTQTQQREALVQRIALLHQAASQLAQARTQHGSVLRRAAQVGLQAGELDPVAYLTFLRQAYSLELEYYRSLLELQLAYAELNYWYSYSEPTQN